MLASTSPNPTVGNLQEMKALYRRLERDAVVIARHSIPLENMVGVMFSDASLGNNTDHKTQVCALADCSIFDANQRYRLQRPQAGPFRLERPLL